MPAPTSETGKFQTVNAVTKIASGKRKLNRQDILWLLVAFCGGGGVTGLSTGAAVVSRTIEAPERIDALTLEVEGLSADIKEIKALLLHSVSQPVRP